MVKNRSDNENHGPNPKFLHTAFEKISIHQTTHVVPTKNTNIYLKITKIELFFFFQSNKTQLIRQELSYSYEPFIRLLYFSYSC